MKNSVFMFLFLVGANIFAAEKKNQQWNEDVIHNYKKMDFNKLSTNEWKKSSMILGFQHRRKPAHYPKDRTQKQCKRKSISLK
jgi:hypothetical protein